jgi:YfiR/HmsC-like
VQRCTNPVSSVAAIYQVLPPVRRLRRELPGGVFPQDAQPKTALLRCTLPIVFAVLGVLFASLCCSAQPAAQVSGSEDDIRAAVLFHLTQFVEWPGKYEAQPYRICIAGSAPTSIALEHLVEGKSVRSHPIRVEQIAGPTEVRGCQIVFIAACARLRLQQYLISLRDSDILTVGEQPGFLDLGGMIQLFFQAQRVGLVVNLETMQRSHLTVSSKLLRLGHRNGETIAIENH